MADIRRQSKLLSILGHAHALTLMYGNRHARRNRLLCCLLNRHLEAPNYGKCKYARMCKFRRTELPCDMQEVAEQYCKVYKIFQKFEIKDHDQALPA